MLNQFHIARSNILKTVLNSLSVESGISQSQYGVDWIPNLHRINITLFRIDHGHMLFNIIQFTMALGWHTR